MKIVLKFIAVPFILSFVLVSCCKKNDTSPTTPLIVPNQWARLSTLPNENITALEVINDVIYAGSTTSDKIYISTDNGATWVASAPLGPVQLSVAAITVFNNKIYVGTDGYIYSSADNGKTWANAGAPTSMITSFATWNNNLYATSYRDGILKLNTTTGLWQSFTTGLTTAVFDNTTTKVMAAGTDLLAATAYSFAGYDTAQQTWVRKNYYNHVPYGGNTWWTDYTIDMIYNQGSIFSQVYMEYPTEQTLMRSDDLGTTWYRDTLKLKTDTRKYLMHGLLAGSSKFYSISNQDTISIGTWIQQRDRAAAARSTWANGEEFLPGISSAAIRENNGVLFLATTNGLYFKRS
jgi:photosystem II stability/assembly factor-like uncharacterized protein